MTDDEAAGTTATTSYGPVHYFEDGDGAPRALHGRGHRRVARTRAGCGGLGIGRFAVAFVQVDGGTHVSLWTDPSSDDLQRQVSAHLAGS